MLEIRSAKLEAKKIFLRSFKNYLKECGKFHDCNQGKELIIFISTELINCYIKENILVNSEYWMEVIKELNKFK